MNPEPLTALLQKWSNGDLAAAEQVLLAYEPQLRMIVRRRLSRSMRAKFDSVDVVQSVWVHVLRDFRELGSRLASTEHLQNFLVQVTRHRLTDRLRRHRVAVEREQTLQEFNTESMLQAPQPRPSEVAQADELWTKMLALCPPAHHEVLRLKRQGLRLEEIADRTGLHEGSVRRILRTLARKMAFP
jgi:RNA polymerase sigma factor (sigma-70 family)